MTYAPFVRRGAAAGGSVRACGRQPAPAIDRVSVVRDGKPIDPARYENSPPPQPNSGNAAPRAGSRDGSRFLRAWRSTPLKMPSVRGSRSPGRHCHRIAIYQARISPTLPCCGWWWTADSRSAVPASLAGWLISTPPASPSCNPMGSIPKSADAPPALPRGEIPRIPGSRVQQQHVHDVAARASDQHHEPRF